MQRKIVWSLDDVLNVRDRYEKPIEENWSLQAIFDEKRPPVAWLPGFQPPMLGSAMQPSKQAAKLVKGENAWGAGGAKTVAQTIMGALNKLTPEKYDDVVAVLKNPEFLLPENSGTLVSLTFKKALLEPNYGEMYARLCLDVARFEMSLQTDSSGQSNLRVEIISRAQKEFENTYNELSELEEIENPEEREVSMDMLRTKRKANIRFVGQLFLQTLVSQMVVTRILIRMMMGSGSKPVEGYIPDEDDAELAMELIETVGCRIERRKEGKEILDPIFNKIQWLVENAAYQMRIKFKLMNTLELRDNNWVERVQKSSSQTPMTLEQAAEKHSKNVMRMASPTTSLATPTRGVKTFPKSPSKAVSPPSGGTPQPYAAIAGAKSRAFPSSPAPRPPSPNRPPKVPKGTLQTLTAQLLKEWSGKPMRGWLERFAPLKIGSELDTRIAVVRQLLVVACKSSNRINHEDTGAMLKTDLGLDREELISGFTAAMLEATESGLLEDIPLFFVRFTFILTAVFGARPADLPDVHHILATITARVVREALAEDPECDALHDAGSAVSALPCNSQFDHKQLDAIAFALSTANIRPAEKNGELLELFFTHYFENDMVSKDTAALWCERATRPEIVTLIGKLKAAGVL